MIDQTVVARLQKDVKLSQTEKSVMQYLVENTDEAIKIGIRGVAQKGYTSTATVMRLAKKLGFEGFREMVYSFRNEMNQASNTLPEELREQIHFIYDMQKLEIFSVFWHVRDLSAFKPRDTRRCLPNIWRKSCWATRVL